jgi:hypothetical protein
MERQSAGSPADVGRTDYVAELERIATSRDTTASARDRVSAIKELLRIESAQEQMTTVVRLVVNQDAEHDISSIDASAEARVDAVDAADQDK